jgi:hypothetical protein
MISSEDITQFDGAISLLRDCVGGKAGERVLIVREPDNYGYYDDKAPRIAAAAGRHLGLRIYETVSDSLITDTDGRTKLIDTLAGFDHIVFFSRVGDQLRFTSDVDIPSSTICYTLDSDALNSNFSKACHHGMTEVKDAIDKAFESAAEIRVTCPLGTDYIGHPNWTIASKTDVCLKRFPLLVPRPIPASGFTGKVALSHFLTGTGSRPYEPYTLDLPVDVIACLDNNKITHFEGDASAVKQVEDHYSTVSKFFDIDPWYVDSWHPGIHPGCQFGSNAKDDIVRWSGTAFGNPRVLHFHTCGEFSPGEICWHVLDPTIELDGIAVWENGTLLPRRIEAAREILERHTNLAELFDNPTRNIGF